MQPERIQLEKDEYIITEVRKHWFVIGIGMCVVCAMAIAPIALYFVFSSFSLHIDIVTNNTVFLFACYMGWLILAWMSLFKVWTNYYLDVWTITNKRLIAVDQRGLFNRYTGSFRLERLQDINVSVRGLLGTFLGYGDLQAETASEDRDFIARGIPNPQALEALILKAADEITFSSTRKNQAQTVVAPEQVNDGL